MRDWWNHGVHEKSLSTYCFLVKFNISKRLDSLRLREWQINIHGMLRHIPFVSPEDTDTYFDSIDSKVSDYEHYLDNAPMLLELAIWKSKVRDQLSQKNTADMKMLSRANSLPMVTIIVRSVLSFL